MALRPTGPAGPWILGLLATLPFAIGAAVYCWGPSILRGHSSRGLLLYSATLISFMAGSRWGVEVGRAPPRFSVLIPAMATPLLAVILIMSMLELDLIWRLVGFIAAFIALWLWDSISTELPAWYPRLRTAVTVVACVSLALVLEHVLRM